MLLLLTLIFLLTVLIPATASAQSASFRAVDTNSDGVLSRNELIAAFGRMGAVRLLRSSDHNNDGRITISELRRGLGEARDEDRDNNGGDGDGGGDD